MLSVMPIASQPIASIYGLDGLIPVPPPSKFLELLNDFSIKRIYLVEISGFSPASGANLFPFSDKSRELIARQWEFSSNTQGWTGLNATVAWTNAGTILLQGTGTAPRLISPAVSPTNGNSSSLIRVRARLVSGTDTGTVFRCFWMNADHGYSNNYQTQVQKSTIANLNSWNTIEFDMSNPLLVGNDAVEDWRTKNWTGLRIDFSDAAGTIWEIDWVRAIDKRGANFADSGFQYDTKMGDTHSFRLQVPGTATTRATYWSSNIQGYIPIDIRKRYLFRTKVRTNRSAPVVSIRAMCLGVEGRANTPNNTTRDSGSYPYELAARSSWWPARNGKLVNDANIGDDTFIITDTVASEWSSLTINRSTLSMKFAVPEGDNPDPMLVPDSAYIIDDITVINPTTVQVRIVTPFNYRGDAYTGILDFYGAGTSVSSGYRRGSPPMVDLTNSPTTYITLPDGFDDNGGPEWLILETIVEGWPELSPTSTLYNGNPEFLRGTTYVATQYVIYDNAGGTPSQVNDTLWVEWQEWIELPSTVRLSDSNYSSAQDNYLPRLEDPFTFDVKLFEDNYLIGASRQSYGTIIINNQDGALDHILTADWDNADIEVKMGAEGFKIEEFGTVFKGKAEQATWNERLINLRLRNARAVLDNNIQTRRFEELLTDYPYMPEELWSKPIPIIYGTCRNVTPVHISSIPNDTYILAGEPLASDWLTTLYSNGNVDSVAGWDVSTPGTLVSNTPSESRTITVDVNGQISQTLSGRFVTTAADIMTDILVKYAGLRYPEDFDLTSLAEVNNRIPAALGIYIDSDVSIANVLDQICSSVGVYWTFNRLGQFFVGSITIAGPTPVATFDDSNIISIQRNATPLPIWKLNMEYDRNWTVFDKSNLAGIIQDDPTKAITFTSEAKTLTISDDNKKTPLANEREIKSLIVNSERDNLVINPSFEDGLSPHVVGGGATGGTWVRTVSTLAHSGVAVLQHTAAGQVNQSWVTFNDIDETFRIPAKRGDTFRCSIWARRITGSAKTYRLFIQHKDAAGEIIESPRIEFTHTTTSWGKYTIETTITGSDVVTVTPVIYTVDNSVTNSVYQFDSVGVYVANAFAIEEAQRQFNLFSVRKDIYEITVRNLNFSINLGQRVILTYPRFGLDGGKVFTVISLRESVKSDTLTLSLWG